VKAQFPFCLGLEPQVAIKIAQQEVNLIVTRVSPRGRLEHPASVARAACLAIGLAEFALRFDGLRNGLGGNLQGTNGTGGIVLSQIHLSEPQVRHAMHRARADLGGQGRFSGVKVAQAPKRGADAVANAGPRRLLFRRLPVEGQRVFPPPAAFEIRRAHLEHRGRFRRRAIQGGQPPLRKIAQNLAGAETRFGVGGLGQQRLDLADRLGQGALFDQGPGQVEASGGRGQASKLAFRRREVALVKQLDAA